MEMRIRPLIAMVACALIVGCAKNPDAIVPMTMPANAYSGLTCDQLSGELAKSNAALVAVSAEQRQAATGDAVGVFLIGVPMSSLTGGDKEGKVAQHKGEVIAIEAVRREKACAPG